MSDILATIPAGAKPAHDASGNVIGSSRPAPKPQRRSLTVNKVGAELHRALEIKTLLGQEGDLDPKLLADMIEGETEFAEACCAVLEEIAEDELMIAGIDAIQTQMGERKGRLEKSVETRRNIILQAMDRAGIDSIKSPLGTMSRAPTQPKLQITDEAKVPSDYFKQPDPVLDRKALKAALDAGTEVEGASLSNGGITLTIRKK